MARHRETTLVKLLEVKRESLHIQEVAATTLPLMNALFWTHAQIPTLPTILDPHNINTLKEWYWTVNMKNDAKEIIDREHNACEVILKTMQELGKIILRSMVSGWVNDQSDEVIPPDWEERLGTNKITYSIKDLGFVGQFHSDMLCFERNRSSWQDGLKQVNQYLEGMQYKIRHPPMPPFSLLFKLCIRFQEYVREERAARRDLWREYLLEESQFLIKGFETGKEKVLS